MTPLRKPVPVSAIRLYRASISGHCHRVELFLSLLGLPHELVNIDLKARTQKSASFLAMNPFGQVPVIQDGAITLADSNAILVYLAMAYAPEHWLPTEPAAAARVQAWLSVAAGLLAYGPAAARAIVLFDRPHNMDEVSARAQSLFLAMEEVLHDSSYLAGDQPTIADIANYSYTALAPEGRLSLEVYPHLRAWLSRIEAWPGFVPMMRSPS